MPTSAISAIASAPRRALPPASTARPCAAEASQQQAGISHALSHRKRACHRVRCDRRRRPAGPDPDVSMDVLTAGVALIVVQLCLAFIMAGIFYVAPNEKCTHHWALSGVTVAFGVLTVVLNNGAWRPPVLLIGNSLVVLGLVFQWSGIRDFFRKPNGVAGWAIAALFVAAFCVLLFLHADVGQRSMLCALTIFLLLGLNFYEMLNGSTVHRSYARVLAVGALALLLFAYGARLYLSLTRPDHFLPTSNSALTITLLYLIPIIGSLLFSNGLLLMYFERIVADKHHLATHDELSGVLNRRAIVAAGERELRLATRLKLPLAVAFIDVDHFKNVNDRYGHEVGDQVLVEVARVIKETCRNIDLVGRYGGEEFCVVFPGVEAAHAAAIGERLVDAMRAHPFPHGLEVTISVGVAALAGDADDRAWASLIRRADIELYRAKDAGRDGYSLAA
ncbi:GGDEF domain-containing protein [Oxalobacteraceae bacterium OM1]|nr:GGDEF domain-containing protein [Oxalobacteraceae bacterium OM1]